MIEHYPDIFEAMEARSYDYLCPRLLQHALFVELAPKRMSAPSSPIAWRCCASELAVSWRGWFGPAVSGTVRTADIAAAQGISYIADYYHDDQPMPVHTNSGTLVSVPYSMEINDAVVYRWQTEGEEFERMIKDAFDVLYAEVSRARACSPFVYILISTVNRTESSIWIGRWTMC